MKKCIVLAVSVVMPLGLAAAAKGEAVPILVFSQRHPAWAGDRMGNGGTIGQQGCLMTSVAMALRVSPKDLNNYLNAHGGYANGGNLIHGVAAAYDGPAGLRYIGVGNLPVNAASVKRGIGRGGVYIVRSYRFPGREHWVIVYQANDSQAYYIDPWDATAHRVGDGAVNYGNQARIYSFR